jgi:dTDP-L-rhamnose 4-epimerase
MRVLVTGGAGFIGRHLVRRLLTEGCRVAVLDNLSPQIHGSTQAFPPDLASHVELFQGDVRDRDLVARVLLKQDIVVHFAAETGTGQSMYEVMRYQDVNIGGTAAILDVMVNHFDCPVSKLVLASSRAIYGEGKYRCPQHGIVYPNSRALDSLRAGHFELKCPRCDAFCVPEATSEDSPSHPLSFYGLTKQVQEEMISMFAGARGFSACTLRYQNVYGPGQSLRNPYTGILAIFSSLARSHSPIEIFEDGQETRDFVFVDDAVEATWRCIKNDKGHVETFNVGTGLQTTVLQAAQEVAQFFGSNSKVIVTGAFRQGDIRHNFADLTRIRHATGYVPGFTFREGLELFLAWAATQEEVPVAYQNSLHEMRDRGLLRG